MGSMVIDPAIEELRAKLDDPYWRLTSGQLYKIISKGDGDEDDLFIPFIPNKSQLELLKNLHHRSLILKARQLGFTTLIAILWLDTALFSKDPIRCAIVAQDREAAESIFASKVKRAYDALPDVLKQAMPLSKNSASELVFAHNGSSIKVATSVRSGTIHRLHISEFGKICAKFPDKAAEVVTGSIPAVPTTGILVIESTAEGTDGEFFDITQRAIALAEQKRPLNQKEYRFHFFPWHADSRYRLNPADVLVSETDNEYFDEIEQAMQCSIDAAQRAWYIATRDSDFENRPERMWQEYPSTPAEAFQKSTEGTYYAKQLTAARKGKRITNVPHMPGIPVNTFWDIGNSDGTAIWFHQRVGMRDHFIKFIEGWEEPYSHFVAEMQKTGWVWGRHYLPHDGAHVRQGESENISPQQMLERLGLRNIEIVDRVTELQHGIQQTRDAFSNYWFDEAGCKEGLAHLQMYRKAWNARLQCWAERPQKDGHTEAADALRQHAQGYRQVSAPAASRRTRNWRTA